MLAEQILKCKENEILKATKPKSKRGTDEGLEGDRECRRGEGGVLKLDPDS